MFAADTAVTPVSNVAMSSGRLVLAFLYLRVNDWTRLEQQSCPGAGDPIHVVGCLSSKVLRAIGLMRGNDILSKYQPEEMQTNAPPRANEVGVHNDRIWREANEKGVRYFIGKVRTGPNLVVAKAQHRYAHPFFMKRLTAS